MTTKRIFRAIYNGAVVALFVILGLTIGNLAFAGYIAIDNDDIVQTHILTVTPQQDPFGVGGNIEIAIIDTGSDYTIGTLSVSNNDWIGYGIYLQSTFYSPYISSLQVGFYDDAITFGYNELVISNPDNLAGFTWNTPNVPGWPTGEYPIWAIQGFEGSYLQFLFPQVIQTPIGEPITELDSGFGSFLGSTTPLSVVANVTTGVTETTGNIAPIFALAGVPATFVIGKYLLWFIRRSTG